MMKDEILELYWIGDVNYATAITGAKVKRRGKYKILSVKRKDAQSADIKLTNQHESVEIR